MRSPEMSGKVIEFPIKNQFKVDNTAAELRENILFTENLTEALVVNMIHNMSENGIDVDNENFIKDTSLLIEMVKSMIYRDSDMTYPLQKFTDVVVKTEREDNKLACKVDLEQIWNFVEPEEDKE